MSRFATELEAVLQSLVAEHRKLLGYVEAQQAAMKKFDLAAMDAARNQQEACRLRVATLENKRRAVVAAMAKFLKVAPETLNLTKVAELHPQRKDALMKVRAELKDLATQITRRAHVAGRLAGAVLGNLNTVVRLLAGAVEKAGLYTKHGIPQVSKRIGVMEAVG
jgi:hypothetical protein